jgi:hypothetical protein
MVDVQKQTPHKSELTTEIKLMGGAVVEVQKHSTTPISTVYVK